MVEKFSEYIAVEKRYSPHTLMSYRKDLEDFSLFLLETEAHQNFEKVDKKVIRNFIIHLSEKKIAKRSINRKLSTLRSFYLFLLKIGDIQVSPMETVDSLKFYAEKQIPFSKDEMNAVEEIAFQNSEIEILEKLVIETLYQTGIRKAELCNLLFINVDYSKNELKIIGKGNKARLIPISENLKSQFLEYSETRNPLKNNEMYFFLSKKGKKLNEKFVYSVVNKYLGLVTSKKKKSPHILRHSFATHILENGAEISKVKTLLGHVSLASTQVYTSANIEQLKKVFNAAHPRAIKQDEQ